MSDAPERPNYRLHFVLFLLTVLTTTIQGAIYAHKGGEILPLRDGLTFSLPLMGILLCHEFGHYFAARLHRVPASLPYFIPLPPFIGLFGTMGAIITQAGTKDRRKLIDIGAAGPLAGLAVAIPVLIWGLRHSEVRPLVGVGFQEGNSLFYAWLKHAIKGEWLPGGGRDVMLHPTAWAGWAGLFITMMNLIPIGQLDGGHVATAYFGNRYTRFSRLVHWALPWLAVAAFGWVYKVAQDEVAPHAVALAVSAEEAQSAAFDMAINVGVMWMAFFGLLWLLGRWMRGLDHPAIDDAPPLPASRGALFWLVAIVFLLIFMPVPFRETVGAEPPPDAGAGGAPP